MTPYPRDNTLHTLPQEEINEEKLSIVHKTEKPTYQIVWRNVVMFIILHSIGLYGIYSIFASAKLATTIWGFFMYQLAAFGITGGAHRLWAHKSYKVVTPLKAVILFCQTMAHQNSVIEWCRDHRVHHKFTETDADPHNAARGFFFSHMGWLLCKKHEDVKEKGKGVDLTDLSEDPLLRWQQKYFIPLMVFTCFVFPTAVPMLMWSETFMNAYSLNILRYICSLHATWLVNSAAHMWGNKPYDKTIRSTENIFVSFFAVGEGWHNYHHTFPWDYKAAEFGKMNLTLHVINFFAKMGWAYDLKSVSQDMVRNRVDRTGDGNHEIWGWGDKDQTEENIKSAVIYSRRDE